MALSEGRTLTFSSLEDEARATRLNIAALGLEDRAVIVSVTGNRAGFFSVFLACLELGFVLVPLDGDSAASEVMTAAEAYGASAIIASERFAPERLAADLVLPGNLRVFRTAGVNRRVDTGAAAVLKVTSGSSDRPKAVITTERNLWHDGRHITTAMDIGAADVNLGSIPLSHSYGLGNLVMPLLVDGTAVVLRDAFVPARLIDDMIACGVTVFPGVPFMFDFIVRHMPDAVFPSSLRLVLTAGARLDFDVLSSFHQRFGRKIHSFYGTSETGGIAYDDEDDIREPVTVGRPLDGVEVTLAPSPDDKIARLHVRSAAVSDGYLDGSGGPEEFADGGFLTGDLGHYDESGRLYLDGRVSQFVNVAGRKVSIEEVERVLMGVPGIVQARVVDVACAVRGQALVACLVLDEPAPTVLDIRAYCARRLSAHKIPRDFIALGALPVDARGKIDRRALAVLASTTAAR